MCQPTCLKKKQKFYSFFLKSIYLALIAKLCICCNIEKALGAFINGNNIVVLTFIILYIFIFILARVSIPAQTFVLAQVFSLALIINSNNKLYQQFLKMYTAIVKALKQNQKITFEKEPFKA